jgi:putative ABC transport system permease protein
MTGHFLKLSIRNILRKKFSSLVNILGLAIGFMGFIAISLYVMGERSYEKYHPDRDNIYRIVHNTFNKDRSVLMLPVLFHEHLEGVPEIERTVRILSYTMGGNYRVGDVELLERNVLYADVNFLKCLALNLPTEAFKPLKKTRTALFLLLQPPNVILVMKTQSGK